MPNVQRNKVANEIVRSLMLLDLRRKQENQPENKQELWEQQMEVVGFCLTSVMKALEADVYYCVESSEMVGEGEKWKPVLRTMSTTYSGVSVKMQKLSEKSHKHTNLKIGRYYREMEI